MPEVDNEKVYERFKSHGLYELQEVVGIWEIRIDGAEGLKINVKVTKGPQGFYLALPDHVPRSGGFHPHGQNNAQHALEDTVDRLLSAVGNGHVSEDDFEATTSY